MIKLNIRREHGNVYILSPGNQKTFHLVNVDSKRIVTLTLSLLNVFTRDPKINKMYYLLNVV